MTDTGLPLEVEQVELSSSEPENLVLRLFGTWRGPGRAPRGGEVLVVETEGRRLRFPAIPERRPFRLGAHKAWSAGFLLPASLKSRLEGAMSVIISNESVPVRRGVDGQLDTEEPDMEDANGAMEPEPPPDEPQSEQTQPLPTVDVLRAELQARSLSEGRARGQVAELRAKLEARTSTQADLNAAQQELRREISTLVERVDSDEAKRAEAESKAASLGDRVKDLEGRIAELQQAVAENRVKREAAVSEAVGLRAEIDRLGRELTGAQTRAMTAADGLGEAKALLDEVRALNARLGNGNGAQPAEVGEGEPPSPAHVGDGEQQPSGDGAEVAQ